MGSNPTPSAIYYNNLMILLAFLTSPYVCLQTCPQVVLRLMTQSTIYCMSETCLHHSDDRSRSRFGSQNLSSNLDASLAPNPSRLSGSMRRRRPNLNTKLKHCCGKSKPIASMPSVATCRPQTLSGSMASCAKSVVGSRARGMSSAARLARSLKGLASGATADDLWPTRFRARINLQSSPSAPAFSSGLPHIEQMTAV